MHLNSPLPESSRSPPAQSQSILVGTFFEALSSDTCLSGPVKTILWDLYRLFALYTMENEGFECEDVLFNYIRSSTLFQG